MSHEFSFDAGVDSVSGIERLLKTAAPWRGADAVAAEILNLWRSELKTSPAVLLWHDLPKYSTRLIALNEGESAEVERRSFPGLHSPDEGLSPSLLFVSPLTWHPLNPSTPDGTPSLMWIGLAESAAWDKIPTLWTSATAQVLYWAVQYDAQLQQAKLRSLAEFAAAAGHEINNPLGSIIGRASLLLKQETEAENRRALETIGAQAYRIGDMIGDTMLFADPPPLTRTPFTLNTLIRRVVAKFEAELTDAGIQCRFSERAIVALRADETQISIVVAELLRNSLRALRDDRRKDQLRERRIQILCDHEDEHGQPGVRFEVADNGPGMTEAEQEHCFDPFYSGRSAGRGLGFGLSKCWRIVERHGGTMTFDSTNDELRFRVWLPNQKD